MFDIYSSESNDVLAFWAVSEDQTPEVEIAEIGEMAEKLAVAKKIPIKFANDITGGLTLEEYEKSFIKKVRDFDLLNGVSSVKPEGREKLKKVVKKAVQDVVLSTEASLNDEAKESIINAALWIMNVWKL